MPRLLPPLALPHDPRPGRPVTGWIVCTLAIAIPGWILGHRIYRRLT